MIASIPSPSFQQITIGPLHFRIYGLMIALGVVAAVWIAQRRLAERGGNPEQISDLALWAVPAGLIGARLYHVITDWNRLYSDGRWWPDAFKIWNGGLGIPGGIIAGFGVGVWYVKRRHWNVAVFMDVAAPALPIAQAVGRLGNYFNQELFGRPTTLPWGLEIDPAHRPPQYAQYATFQPTFLYEALWNIGLCLVLLAIDSRRKLRSGKLFPLYVGGYFLGRMWVEELRSDTAARVGGIRWNFLFSILMVLLSLVWFLWRGPFLKPGETQERLVADDGPEVAGPLPEVEVAESDETDAGPAERATAREGIDPEERAAPAEVPEG